MTLIDLFIASIIFVTIVVVYCIDPNFKDCRPGLHNIAVMISWYLGCIRIPCLIQSIHYFHSYKHKSLYLLAIYLVYEEIAMVVLLWARVRWSHIEDCEPNAMFGVLFGVMYISFFIIGRAILTIVLIWIIAGIMLIMYFRGIRRNKQHTRLLQDIQSQTHGEILDEFGDDVNFDPEWIICMEEFQPEEQCVLLPCAKKHLFHKKCITEWLKVKAEWPYDREEIDLRSLVKK